jgi:hypothetical protein
MAASQSPYPVADRPNACRASTTSSADVAPTASAASVCIITSARSNEERRNARAAPES